MNYHPGMLQDDRTALDFLFPAVNQLSVVYQMLMILYAPKMLNRQLSL